MSARELSIGTRARINAVNAQHPALPLRRCADCVLNLSPQFTLRALGVCPMFGFSRHGAELRCHRFEAKAVA